MLSTQVPQEFHVVVTRKLDPPMRKGAAHELVVLYATWPVVQVEAARPTSGA